MPSRDRQVPPGRARIAAAARAGLIPSAGRLVAGAVLLTAAGALAIAGDDIAGYLRGTVAAGLETAALSRPDPAAALADASSSALGASLWFFLLIFLSAAVCAGLPAVWLRARRGRTAVALPKPPEHRLARAALGLFGGALLFCLALAIARSRAGALWRLMEGDFGALWPLARAAVELLAAGGAVLALTGLGDWLMTRHGIWRSLFLTGAESRAERRASGEESPVKKARASGARGGAGR